MSTYRFLPWDIAEQSPTISRQWAFNLNNVVDSLDSTTNLATSLRTFTEALDTAIQGINSDIAVIFNRIHEFRHDRVATGSLTAGSYTDITLTWAVPFVDENYTVVAGILDSSAAGANLNVERVVSKTKDAAVIEVHHEGELASSGIIHGIAIHD